MDTPEETLPDEDAETPDLTTADWLADVDRYYQDDRPAPRTAREFTVNEWRDLMSERRGVQLHRNQASNELAKLVQAGKVKKRYTIVDGKWTWVYWFVLDNIPDK